MLLDKFLPTYQFNEVHTLVIEAPAHCAYEAIKQVTPDEISLFRTLMGIRALPALFKPGRTRFYQQGQPLLEYVTSTSFLLLADKPDREIAVGTVQQFWRLTGGMPPEKISTPEQFVAFDLTDYGKAALNFYIQPSRDGKRSRVRTETRIYLPDRQTEWKFRLYWLFVRTGSALIRLTWLRAIKRRAERDCE